MWKIVSPRVVVDTRDMQRAACENWDVFMQNSSSCLGGWRTEADCEQHDVKIVVSLRHCRVQDEARQRDPGIWQSSKQYCCVMAEPGNKTWSGCRPYSLQNQHHCKWSLNKKPKSCFVRHPAPTRQPTLHTGIPTSFSPLSRRVLIVHRP